jgi:hypothetical protein
MFVKNGFVLTMTGEGVGMIEDGAVAEDYMAAGSQLARAARKGLL